MVLEIFSEDRTLICVFGLILTLELPNTKIILKLSYMRVQEMIFKLLLAKLLCTSQGAYRLKAGGFQA